MATKTVGVTMKSGCGLSFTRIKYFIPGFLLTNLAIMNGGAVQIPIGVQVGRGSIFKVGLLIFRGTF